MNDDHDLLKDMDFSGYQAFHLNICIFLIFIFSLFQNHDINLAHIESRSSKRAEDAYEFMVEIDSGSNGNIQAALDTIKV